MSYRLLQRALFPVVLIVVISLSFAMEVNMASHKITVPAEPLLALAALVIIALLTRSYRELWDTIDRPLFLVCTSMIIWLLITSLTSVLPTVSIKSTLVEGVHWLVFFIGIILIFKNRKTGGLALLLSALSLSMGLVIIYTWFHHGMHGFRPNTAQIAAQPFLKDHTLYGACFAMMVPWNIWLAAYWRQHKRALSRVHLAFVLVLLLAVFLSFSRVAWIGLIGAALILGLRRQTWKIALIVFVVLGGLVVALTSSGTQSTQRGDGILPFIAGVSSWQQDVSVRERLNRYKSALRMSRVRPWLGFGPGTYQFEYHPFQKEEEMTRISSTGPVHDVPGRGGSTHSEYLKALAETGFPGLIIWVVILVFGLSRSWAPAGETADQTHLRLACRASILIYLIIGIFNNFVHEGIMAFFFWLPLALLGALPNITPAEQAVG